MCCSHSFFFRSIFTLILKVNFPAPDSTRPPPFNINSSNPYKFPFNPAQLRAIEAAPVVPGAQLSTVLTSNLAAARCFQIDLNATPPPYPVSRRHHPELSID
jgi:hypothetical protein